jgi:hypothetical protein
MRWSLAKIDLAVAVQRKGQRFPVLALIVPGLFRVECVYSRVPALVWRGALALEANGVERQPICLRLGKFAASRGR